MKYFRKAAALVLTLIMTLAVAKTGFSAMAYKITMTGSTHTYEVYQIFKGYPSEGILTDVVWGTNGIGTKDEVVDESILEELNALSGKSDTEKLAVIEKYADLNPANKHGELTPEVPTIYVDGGYYLIKDIDGALAGTDDTYTKYIVRIVNDVVISPKSNKTTAEKTVTDINDSTAETSVGNTADYDIGDQVPFHLKATIDSEYDRYIAYKLVFHDTLSSGLRLNESGISVKVDGGASLVKGKDYTVVSSGLSDGCGFEVRFENLKQIASVKAGSSITVDYTAELTADAVTGMAGNDNKLVVEYSNNPNDETGAETGKTPEHKVVVFTYQTIINKVTENPDYNPEIEGSQRYIPLSGAAFQLLKLVKQGSESRWAIQDVTVNEEETVFTFTGLDEGRYCLTELYAPIGYNSIEPVYFNIVSSVDGGMIVNLEGVQTNKDGIVLDGDSISAAFTPNLSDGSLNTDVVNNMGAQLPETGGIGTVIFYAAGSGLVVLAAVLLIIRRCMGNVK